MAEDPKRHRPAGSGRVAFRGMVWTAAALIFSKALSFVSQIALGYLLAVETYAIFALVTTAMIFVSGFQNSGVSKALIQQQERLDDLLPEYSAFALWMGLIGFVLLVVTGAAFQSLYDVPGLFPIIFVQALSLPLIAMSTILMAVLSARLAFRTINLIEMRRSLAYYAVLIVGAALGTAGFTMALALVAGAILHLAMLTRAAAPFRIGIRLSFARFRALAWQLRWIIISAFLFALGMNGDYLVLAKMLHPQELGYYFFGFMLITNVTILLASGINQTLLPVFSRLKNDLPALQRQVLMSSGAITLLACILSICLIGFGAVMVHLIWGGKWDGAIVVVLSVAAIQPLRLTATMGGVVLEAQGAWSLRLATLLFDGALILICSAVGAWLGGLFGASIAVAVQRAVTGLVTFPMGARRIGIGWRRIVAFWLRCLGPYVLVVAGLFLLAPDRYADADTWVIVGRAALETAGALAVFMAANMVLNRDLLGAMAGVIRSRKPA
ncbi:oligosaccharide flippase family protein [Frigidibacter albus]|uniref:Oligosaccharide flippase family protein n=1 Tax=Frigidibacter albus TaxID=1465486 RepID=A0A6L8VLI9_9RHOB|nr:oligosaccharide flippase family protein [Frigidibacter albus]MZQ91245.1 oligosaccharide flippase family protein [Frigidibacter albus]NBE33172.1 oligosaccharide flippase family protein [Frigidibacter albus]GGH63446.1 hypothetical protein GCM10011341_38580 [Frigidibacter albus]